ncbi:SdiA-regulated domain-containing protein [Winogradskyella forsetii]|uniref:SdiA-regulated domain-containing protein n=1 Tax=Winogradskyella forsetii TaxID=2686077 RepID=UPI0015B9C0BE|nr:SdiA-regulated domain-containing protein [Winogradskyella forsetii]
MNLKKYIPHILIIILAIIVITSCANTYTKPTNSTTEVTTPKTLNDNYSIIKKWELPEILNEVSGISWLSENTIACVEDEDGIIFIYDLKKQKIIQQILFAGVGDYEGITVNGDDAYVMRSDGLIYEVLRFRESEPTISTFQTEFTADNNIETLALDIKRKSLIVTPKDRDRSDNFKGLYYISLNSRMMDATPAVRINMDDAALKDFQKKKVYRTFNPSDVAIHPKTGQYYVLEGRNPKLVILDSDGTIEKVIELDTNDFAQPEGITFNPDGRLFISNEAGKDAANILEVIIR